MDFLPHQTAAALLGLAGGLVLGLAGRLAHFCTLGALESAIYGHDQTRLRMWGIVLGVSIAGVHMLAATGHIDLSLTIYHQIRWNPLASIAGGAIFGYGMALAGNCGYSALTRFGGGDLKAMVMIVVMAVFGFITLNGPLSRLRLRLFPQEPAEGLNSIAHDLAAILPFSPLLIAIAIATAFFLWGISHEGLRRDPARIFWAAAVGGAIISAFWGTSYLNFLSFGETFVQGHTFVAPLGRTLLYLMTSSAGGLEFSVGSVIGVMAGAFIGSWIRQDFQWEACEDPRELGRQVTGAALMGIGGIVAMGCTIGQGVSGFATLAWSAPVTLISIAAGALLGLRHLLEGFEPQE